MRDRDLPLLFHRADAAALGSQRSTVMWLRNQVALLVVAAVCAGLPWRWEIGPVDAPSLVGAASYVGALWFTWLTARHRPRDSWQLHRSAAELLRSHCWRYAVCGAPYDAGRLDPDSTLQAVLHEALQRLRVIGWREPPVTGPGEVLQPLITSGMRELRAKTFEVRRDTYIRDRVQEQQDWYRRRAAESRRGALLWQALTVLGTLVALATAVAKAFGWGASWDLAGMASAAAAAAVAWSEVRQFQPLVAAHALVAQELSASVFALRRVNSEAVWAANVEATEERVSPDYTAWLARHHG